MKRKRIGLIVLSLVLAVVGAGAGMVWALFQVPEFYANALTAQPEPAVRKTDARQLVQRTMRLVDDIRHQDTWSEEFTQQQVNSWLAEDLHSKFAAFLPPSVHEPRVLFAKGAVHIGFRYEDEKWSGVVSVKARPWIPEPNQLAMEIESVRAGLVPIPLDNVIQEISKRFKTEGWHSQWKQRNGNDVLVLYFDAVKKGDPVLEAIEVANGAVRVAGSRRTSADVSADHRTGQVVPGDGTAEGPHHSKSFPLPTRIAEQFSQGGAQVGKN